MPHLPSTDEQQWISRHVTALIQSRGANPFLHAPILEPTDEYFPEPWAPNRHGIELLLRRLLIYAGLPQLKPAVQLFEGRHGRPIIEGTHHWDDTPAWFVGLEGDTCRFELNASQIEAPDTLVGVLCHEVAHVWRRFHGLETESPEEEERLTDLTALYLGFGLLVTNNAFKYRTRGDIRGTIVNYEWSHQQVGYLSLEEFCFALAIQALARGWSPQQLRRFRGLLEPAQAETFDHAVAHLGRDAAALRERHGLPREPAPAPPREHAVATPLAESVEHEPDEVLKVDPALRRLRRKYAGDTTTRKRGERNLARAAAWALVSGLGGLIPAMFVSILWNQVTKGHDDTAAVLPVATIFAIAGFLWGSRRAADRCTHRDCDMLLDEAAQACPRCGCEIVQDLA
jgi:hypothetical protein